MAHEELKKQYEEPVFEPEYFSGLNWREALPLVGKVVEFSDNPDHNGWIKGVLCAVDSIGGGSRFKLRIFCYEYIRTTPQTYAHPTIAIEVNGKEYKLPRPEVEAPEYGTVIYIFAPELPKKFFTISWFADEMNDCRLRDGVVHLTEDRAQAWGSWWRDTVVAAVNK